MSRGPSGTAHDNRVRFIDASRGAAMGFVLLSHFAFTYFPDQTGTAPTLMRLIGMVASPTFMTLSGLLIGFLYRVRPGSFARLRVKLFDRGLFLLTTGHVIILASHAPYYTTRFLSITDAVGVCMLVQPFLIERIGARGRLSLALGIYAVSWVAIELWVPHTAALQFIKETAFGGVQGPSYYRYAFPVLPWFSLDLAATVFGERLGQHYLERDTTAMQRLLATTWAASWALAIAAMTVYWFAIHPYATVETVNLARLLSSPFSKAPPGPVYILSYGGIGLGLMSTCLWLERTGIARRTLDHMAALGQMSLFVFLSHWFVYLVLLEAIRSYLPFAAWAWPVYFVISAVMILWLTQLWRRSGCNRFLTVGYPLVHDSIAQASDEIALGKAGAVLR